MHCREKINCIVDNFKKIAGIKSNKSAAQLLGISDRDFSNRKRSGTLSRIIVEWAANQKMDINRIIYGDDSVESYSQFCCKITDVSETAKETTAQKEEEGILCPLNREWIARSTTSEENTLIMTISGNSMEPSLRDGDIVVIDKGRAIVHDGGLFAVRMDGMLLIKRLSPRPRDKMKVISDNKEYDPYEIDRRNIEIAGQVVLIVKLLVN